METTSQWSLSNPSHNLPYFCSSFWSGAIEQMTLCLLKQRDSFTDNASKIEAMAKFAQTMVDHFKLIYVIHLTKRDVKSNSPASTTYPHLAPLVDYRQVTNCHVMICANFAAFCMQRGWRFSDCPLEDIVKSTSELIASLVL